MYFELDNDDDDDMETSFLKGWTSLLRWPAGIYRANGCLFKSRFFEAKLQAIS